MTRTHHIATFAVATLLAHSAFAQTFQTVDDFNLFPYIDSVAQALGKDPFGNIYAAGYTVIDSNYNSVAAIRRSTDAGATWNTIDLFSQGEAAPVYEHTAITSDAAGVLYVAGRGNAYWFVRRSLDGGATWSTVDALSGATVLNAASADSAGNIYVAGNMSPNWIVRKGTSGSAWSTADAFNPGSSASAKAVLCHPTTGVFVLGIGYAKSGSASWYVRRSQNGGASWTTVDIFSGDYASSIGSDGAGNIYTTGRSAGHWMVRKSSNGGASWTTVDDFKLPCTTLSTKPVRTQCYNARAVGFAADSVGNLFVAGVTESSTGHRWIVRESVGGTGPWQTVDDFQYVAGKEEWPNGIVTDYSGHVFVGGFATDNSAAYNGYGAYHWILRRN